MGRAPCCSKKQGLNRGAWTAMEDQTLTHYITTHGQGKWRNIPKNAGLNRCGKGCRLRWLNYLRPDIKRGNITIDEEELIIRLHKLLGNRWALIAGRLPGRTDNEIKNYWNTIIGKKIINHKSSTPSHRVSQIDQFNSQNHIKRSLSSNFDENVYENEYRYLDPCIVFEKSKDITNPEDNFLMNFEVDRDFLSDILNSTEFSQVTSPDSGFLLDETEDILSMGSFLGSDR